MLASTLRIVARIAGVPAPNAWWRQIRWRRWLPLQHCSSPCPAALHAQQGLLPGEAFITKFSGTTTVAGPTGPRTVIDQAGIVGAVIDLRTPGFPADGRHWLDEPHLFSVTAGDVGQVFGVAVDDANPPSIYLTATSAFGLHRNADNSGWLEGVWGAGGGPGTVYRLNAATANSGQDA